MKTFKIRYEFFNRSQKGGFWDIAGAVVLADNEHQACEIFYSEVDDLSAKILTHDELVTKQIIWTF